MSVTAKQRILIVDDHPVVREGLVRLLNKDERLDVCGDAADHVEAMAKLAALKPHLVIVDISLGGVNGIDLTKEIRHRYPKLRILILSMHKETLHADRALRAGANGYIMKHESGDKLLEAIHQVLDGHIYVSKAVSDMMLQQVSQAKDTDDPAQSFVHTLSDRELEIFQLIGQGYGTRQIADALNVSIKTVETHRQRIREKLNLNNTFELIQHAIHWLHHEKPN